MEEKAGLQIHAQKLAEEALYAKQLAAAAAVELKNLAEEVTKLSFQNAKLQNDLTAAQDLAYTRVLTKPAVSGNVFKVWFEYFKVYVNVYAMRSCTVSNICTSSLLRATKRVARKNGKRSWLRSSSCGQGKHGGATPVEVGRSKAEGGRA